MDSNGIWMLINKIILMYSISEINGFSYNVNSKISYTPRKTNGNSYFGYSTMLRNGDVPMIIVGAPQETSYHMNHSSINAPGVIYTCDINFNENNTTCDQYTIDPAGNARYYNANGQQRQDRKDNMWLGMSMDGESESDGVAVLCAPKWSNQYNPGKYLANGICYKITNFKNTSREDLLPLLFSRKQVYKTSTPSGSTPFYYAYGQAGVSSKISDDGTEMLLGAPGVYNWTGTVVRYKLERENSEIHTSYPDIPNPYLSPKLKDDSYLGYSVGFGKFLSSRPTIYVSGAPRGSVCKGEVIIFDLLDEDDTRLDIIAKLEGKQIGEYFGYSIAALDINGDNLTDLVIGAPTYATKSTWDLGRVYVYMNQDNGKFSEQDTLISGNSSSGARFGSVIAEIGDLNGDGYKDVAIGSPYENDGEGAVYIYLGSENGLRETYVQRISVKGMQGFGISISKGVDIDKNTCNDIAVGAFESGNVTLFRCHPTIEPKMTITSTPERLSIEATEFAIDFCVEFQNTNMITELDFKVNPDFEYRRVTCNKQEDSTFSFGNRDGLRFCKNILLKINKMEVDFSRPIDIQVKYNLKKNPMDDSTFCPHCPVLSPIIKREVSISVPFTAGCGSDLICTPDIQVLLSTTSELPFIIGKSNILPLTITLKNSVERAFLPKIDLQFPAKTQISRVPSQCDVFKNTLMCNFTSPLHPNRNETLDVEFDASKLKNTDELLSFFINGTSGGEEVNPEDNIFQLDIKLINKFKLEMAGYFGSNQYINVPPKSETSENITVVHSYELINEGPTTVDIVNLTFFIPVMINDSDENTFKTILHVKEPAAMLNLQNCICKPLIGSFYKDSNGLDSTKSMKTTKELQLINETVDKLLGYLPRNIDDNLHLDAYRLNCTNSTHVKCLVVQCSGTDLKPGTSGVQIAYEMNLFTSNLDEILERENAVMISTYAIAETKIQSIRLLKWVNTLLVTPKTISPQQPIWMYVLSALLGIVILVVIIYILYKYGFFNRKEKESLEELKSNEPNQTVASRKTESAENIIS